jgi:hypothetical protein
MRKVALCTGLVLYEHELPQESVRHYLNDIEQALTLLVLTASFTAAF